jgi:hypothetical protein
VEHIAKERQYHGGLISQEELRAVLEKIGDLTFE